MLSSRFPVCLLAFQFICSYLIETVSEVESGIFYFIKMKINFLLLYSGTSKIIEKREASSFLRARRANTGIEETLGGANLERECIEELCNYEEFREIDEDQRNQVIFNLIFLLMQGSNYRTKLDCEAVRKQTFPYCFASQYCDLAL